MARIWDIPLLLLLSFAFGSAFAMIKVAIPEVGPEVLVIVRCALGAVVLLLAVVILRSTRWPTSRQEWFWLMLVSFFSTAMPFWLISFAEQKISSSMAGVLMTVQPVIAIILGHLLTSDEKINRGKLIGVGIGFVGAIFLLREGVQELGGTDIIYPLAMIMAVICYVIGGFMAKRLGKVSSEAIAFLVLISSVLMMLAVLAARGRSFPDPASISFNAWGALIWLGVISSAMGFFLRYLLVKRAGYSFTSYIGYLIPIFAILIGNVWLGEVVSPETLIVLGVVIIGIFFTRGAGDFPWNISPALTKFKNKLD